MERTVKTKRTLFTEEKIANLRKNIETLDWAKEKAEKIVAAADIYLSRGVDELITHFLPQEIGRSYYVNQIIGCPNCGKELLRHKNGHWDMDWEAHPWKVKCPHCGNLYPSNDFGAFHKSGLDEHGLFSYERADRSLLVNELYPDKPADYCVDDGQGWYLDRSDPFNCRFLFIANLNGWSIHSSEDMFAEHLTGVTAFMTLAHAYLITDDKRYGWAAAQLYLRFSQLYPTMDISPYLWEEGFSYSDGGGGTGRILGCIHDAVWMYYLSQVYDILFPCIDDDFAAYIRENPVRYLGEPPKDGKTICSIIENDLLLTAFPDSKVDILHANPGYVQVALMQNARILQRDDLFDLYADYIWNYVETVHNHQFWYDLDSLFTSEVNRDGMAGEVSAGYNCGWLWGFMEVARLMRGSKYNLLEKPKFRQLGEMMAKYVSADRYTLPIGDSQCCGIPGILTHADAQIRFFQEYGFVESAQILVQNAGDGQICTDWFEDCAEMDRQIREAVAKSGPFCSKSRCMSVYGLAAVESHPEGKDPESHALWFGKNWGHSHADTMNLHLYGFGIDMMPDFGTPSFKDRNPLRFHWESNALSHNTAIIRQKAPFGDEIAQDDSYFYHKNTNIIDGAQIRHYLNNGKVSLIDVEAPKLYNEPYRRTVVSVDLDGKSRYLVDLFTVGGDNQYLSYHAAGTETSAYGMNFTEQNGGTYAGADIPYADEAYGRRWCDGFNYLTDVRRADVDGIGAVDWKCFDNWKVWDRERDVHMKIHLLSGTDEAALCTGLPPQTKKDNPRKLTYLILRHKNGTAQFANILEPYEDAAFIAACDYKQDGDAVTITVTHINGREDTITVVKNGTKLRVAVDSSCGYAMTYGDTVLGGEVIDFTRELAAENFVTVKLAGDADADRLVGNFMDIETDIEPNAFYEIKSAEALGNGLWKFGTGTCTFVNRYIDRFHKEKGYEYFIKPDAMIRITM